MSDNLCQAFYRPSRNPSLKIPLGVMSAGRYRVGHPFTSHVKNIQFAQLFWGVSGSGVIEINGVERILKPGRVGLYLPGMLHKWHTNGRTWDFFWMALDGPLTVTILSAFGLDADIHDAGPCPVQLFKKLLRAGNDPSPHAEIDSSSLAFQILFRAVARDEKHLDPLTSTAVEQIHENWQRHDFNIKSLADKLRVDRSVLSRRFSKALGAAPGDYLARLRIQNALMLLQNSSLPVKEIVARCGYVDIAYFSRLISAVTGHSPRKLRANPDTIR